MCMSTLEKPIIALMHRLLKKSNSYQILLIKLACHSNYTYAEGKQGGQVDRPLDFSTVQLAPQ